MAEGGKCPKCGKSITRLRLVSTKASLDVLKKDFPTASFICPSCNAALGAQIDPVALMSGTIKRVANALTNVRSKL